MKIAILSDIHGNNLALQAVLEDINLLSIDRLFVLGDFVGYYYHPEKVLELLETWQTDCVQGNHEAMLKKAHNNKRKRIEIRRKYGRGIDFALQKLSEDQIEFLYKLESFKSISIDGLNILLCHGSPWNRDFYVYPDKIINVLDKFKEFKSDFIFIGHTHYPFVFAGKNQVIANVGSVGQARDKGGMASWIILDTSNKSAVFKHTPYDVSEIVDEVKRIDPDVPYLHQILERGQ